jgi:hypothetical protein
MSDITYVGKLTGELRETVVACYVGSLQNTYCESSLTPMMPHANVYNSIVLDICTAVLRRIAFPH